MYIKKFNSKIYRLNQKIKLNRIKKTVFTNGCFDILHPGHIHYLQKSRKLGDQLIVGLNSDSSISLIKGKTRPINNFEFRSKMLSSIEFVDIIIEFDDITPLNLIKKINPHYLVKGGDYVKKNIVGASYVKKYGGKIVTIDFLDNFSSSEIINKIKKIED